MSRSVRTILLTFAILVFLGTGAYLVILGNGLVWDKTTLSFVKTGGIFLSAEPWGATIYLNGEPYPDTTSFLSRGILIQNLTPKTYAVRLEKEGFFPWEKTLTVIPGEVASAHDVRLWSQNPDASVVAAGVEDFWITKQGLLYKTTTGTLEFEKRPIRGTTVFFSSPNSNLVVTKDRSSLFLTDLLNSESITNLSSLFSSLLHRQHPTASADIISIFPHPTNTSRILIYTTSGLYSMEPERVELSQLLPLGPQSFFSMRDRSAHAFDTNGHLRSFYFSFGTSASTTPTLPFPTSSINQILSSEDGEMIVFETDKAAYLYDQSDGTFFITEKPRATQRIFSPENKRMFSFFSNNKWSVTYTDDYEHDALFEKGVHETGMFAYQIGTSTEFAWLPYRNALLAINRNNVIGIDTDMRLPSNTRLLIEDAKRIAWDDGLFVLKQNGEVWKIEY